MRGELDPFKDQPEVAGASRAVASGNIGSSSSVAAAATAAAAEIDRRLQLALQNSDESMDLS